MKSQERVTLKKMAEILELDVSSISLALRNSPKISLQTRRQVQDLANQYNYSPNLAARQLRSATPQLIGLVLPSMTNALSNPRPEGPVRSWRSYAPPEASCFR